MNENEVQRKMNDAQAINNIYLSEKEVRRLIFCLGYNGATCDRALILKLIEKGGTKKC